MTPFVANSYVCLGGDVGGLPAPTAVHVAWPDEHRICVGTLFVGRSSGWGFLVLGVGLSGLYLLRKRMTAGVQGALLSAGGDNSACGRGTGVG